MAFSELEEGRFQKIATFLEDRQKGQAFSTTLNSIQNNPAQGLVNVHDPESTLEFCVLVSSEGKHLLR